MFKKTVLFLHGGFPNVDVDGVRYKLLPIFNADVDVNVDGIRGKLLPIFNADVDFDVDGDGVTEVEFVNAVTASGSVKFLPWSS